ncbi:hypothetical protein J4466_05440 [Candidatus Pacearchaeota archaeon]|nr:hypothetical protein [Candidatus Pacearchaeota archaeon]
MEELKELMIFCNPNKSRYLDLSRFEDRKYLYSYYSDRLSGNTSLPPIERVLREKIPKGVLVDVGAGPHSYSNVFSLAIDFGAKAYIGFDLGFKKLRVVDDFDPKGFLVPEDMLVGISKVNVNSANFSFNGIDWLTRDYGEAIVDELERATIDEGIIFGVGSEGVQLLINHRKSFRKLNLEGYYHDWFIYQKN